jgi:hypothetical protein
MNQKTIKPLSEARDADARATVAALHRAAQKARQLADQTNTPLVIIHPKALPQAGANTASSKA